MLSPNERAAYSEALRPPPGYRFDEAVAATYSLDLTTLLTVPLHLALYSGDRPHDELLGDGIALLEALRKTTSRMDIYCERARIHAPDTRRTLFSLLEPVVHEVTSPNGGSFHPKLWVLRFVAVDVDHPPRLRALVLSRNLTADRCWDLSLSLEGEAGAEARPENAELAGLLRALPSMSAPDARRSTATTVARADRLAAEIERCEWMLPDGFESLRFHALGVPGVGTGRGWLPEPNRRLVVISPFVSAAALDVLAGTTAEPLALISRPDELAAVDGPALKRFGRVLVLDEAAEIEDGEDVAHYREPDSALRGLHAKAYVYSRGWRTHLVMGSANATTAALVAGVNVELLAELVSRRTRGRTPDGILEKENFGKVLTDFVVEDEPRIDEALEAARARLEVARDALAGAALRLRCVRGERVDRAGAPATGEDGAWYLSLECAVPLRLPPSVTARAYPITLSPDRAQAVDALGAGGVLEYAVPDVAHLTSFVAFELTTSDPGSGSVSGPEQRIAFTLALPIDGLPAAERDAAILRDVIRNRDGFVRYLLLLLAAEGEDIGGSGMLRLWSGRNGATSPPDLHEFPLLEAMTRAYCRDIPKLRAVRRLVQELSTSEAYADVVPREFWELWEAFETALGDDVAPRSSPP